MTSSQVKIRDLKTIADLENALYQLESDERNFLYNGRESIPTSHYESTIRRLEAKIKRYEMKKD